MKILHVINSFHALGGAEIALARLINGLPEHKHKILPLMQVSDTNRQLLDLPLVLLEPFGIRSLAGLYPAFSGVRDVVEQERVQLVMGWMYMANAMCSMALGGANKATPHLWSIHHALDDLGHESMATRCAIAACRMFKKRPAHIVYVGQRIKEQHEQQGFACDRASVIGHAVSLNTTTVREPSHTHCVGVLARWHGAKDWPTVVEAMGIALEKNALTHFVLGGAGITQDNDELMSLLHRHGVDMQRVQLLGQLADTTEFYRQIDILMLGSRTEAGPIVLIEAIANGVATVTTDVGDARYIVGNNDSVVAIGDANAMAARVVYLLDNPFERQQIISAGLVRVESTFMESTQLAAYRALFESLV